MVRSLLVVAVMLTALGCGEQPRAAKPAGTAQEADVVTNNASDLPQDSFRLAIDDVRSNGVAVKRIFLITVPSSAKRIRVFLGPVEQALSWSLNLHPSSEAEHICSFEVSQPVVEQKESSKYVTVVCKLSTPNSTSESPLGFAADDTTILDLDDVVSFAAKPGLYKQDTPVLLGNLKFGVSNEQPLTLYVKTDAADPTPK